MASWLAGKKDARYLAVGAAAIRMEGSHTPHFGLIFPLALEEAGKTDIAGVCPFLRKFLGEHKDEWDIYGWEDDRVILLVPKRYIFMAPVFSFFIRLAPKSGNRAGCIGVRINKSFSPFYFSNAIISIESISVCGWHSLISRR